MKNIVIIKVVINDKFGFIISDLVNLFLNCLYFKYRL